jgi:hypothetical protein
LGKPFIKLLYQSLCWVVWCDVQWLGELFKAANNASWLAIAKESLLKLLKKNDKKNGKISK